MSGFILTEERVMNTINLNISNFIAPKSKTEYIQLLDEAIRTADELNDQLDCMDAILKEKDCSLLAA